MPIIALALSSQAAAVLEHRCRRLDKALADTHVFHQDRESFKAGIASYDTQLRQLREYLERSERQISFSGAAGSASTSAMPAAFATFLEELRSLQQVIPAPLATSGPSDAAVPTTPVSSGTLGGATAPAGSSTFLTVASDASGNTGSVIPSTLHKAKGKRPAKSSTKPQSTPPPPKKKQRLGRPSMESESCSSGSVRGFKPQRVFTERSIAAPRHHCFSVIGGGLCDCGLSIQ
ncbi:unnamed protein product [Phytophthora fragariaefolia]|uniref:Unnamed protein product n=1 Tax=Phytophthora fragariaefolia TaxID=1490495 RepID=A0A9W6YMH3_9STRA|nr:unnamed protein product [Phytophthora fragariaefolia]